MTVYWPYLNWWARMLRGDMSGEYRFELITKNDHRELIRAVDTARLKGAKIVGMVILDYKVSTQLHQVIAWEKKTKK